MPPVNPYLRKKQAQPVLAAPTHAAAVTGKSHKMAAAKPNKQANSVPAPKHRPTTVSTVQQRLSAPPPSVPKSSPRHSVPPPPPGAATNRKAFSKGIIKPTPVVSSSKNKSMSFKSKLKQEIESLKRAKQLEKQRKLQEEQAKKLEAQRGEQQKQEHQLTEQQQVRKRQLLMAEARVYYDLLRGGNMLRKDIPSHVQHLIPGYQPTTSNMNAPATINQVTPAKMTSENVQQTQSSESRRLPVQQVTPATVSSNPSPSTQSIFDNSVAAMPSSTTSTDITSAATSMNVQSTQNLPVSHKAGGAIVKVEKAKVVKSVEAKPAAKDERPIDPNTKIPAVVPTTTLLKDGDNCVEASSVVLPVKTEYPTAMVGYGSAHPNTLAFNQMYPGFADERLNYMMNGAALLHAQYTRMSTESVPPYGWNPYPYHPYHPTMNPAWMQPPAPPQAIPTRVLAPTPTRATTLPLPKTCILHHEPLNPVSPYSTSHTLLKGEVVIYKMAGETFGVSFKYDAQSTLVEPDIADKLNAELVSNGKSVKSQTATEKETSDMVDNNVAANVRTTGAATPSSINSTPKERESAPQVQNVLMATDVSKGSSTPSTNIVTDGAAKHREKQRRPRRRRVFFGVLKVVHADKQNAQFKTESSNGIMVKPGDIILKVNGTDVGGLTFQQAIALFASCDTTSDQTASTLNSSKSNQSLIRCPLVVARMKAPSLQGRSAQVVSHGPQFHGQPLPVPSMRIPFVLNTITNQIQSGDFSNTEVLALARGALRCISAESRALGHLPSPNLELACLQSTALGQRDISSIKAKQNHTILSIEQSLKELATTHWTNQWKIEQQKAGVSGLQLAHLSDAQRSAMRALPRPAKGCRCGRMDHGHVNDSNCVLYRNLRVLAEAKWSPDKKREIKKANTSGNLNAVETAYKDRILKLKAETEREEEEAHFVERMEELQVKQLKVAVFAPTLTAMVLSAVCELAKDISKDDSIDKDCRNTITLGNTKSETHSGVSPESPKDYVDAATKSSSSSSSSSVETPKVARNAVDDNEDESDEDDDMPLVSLCKKRAASSDQESDSKRPKVQAGPNAAESTIDKNPYAMKERSSLNLSFLARILRHCSQTWGHLYKEPTDSEYAWRWEVFHGQTSTATDAHRDSKRRNPRLVDSHSLENIRFALNDDVISRLSAATTSNGNSLLKSDVSSLEEASNDMLVLGWLLSPKRTGVYDEIMALMTMGVLRRTISGCVVLAKDWALHVDPLLLNDMEEHWCKRLDPRNKHCMSRSVRTQLEREWTRVRGGWALSSDLHDIVYPGDEWNEWKEHFQDRFESQINDAEGIEKFGI